MAGSVFEFRGVEDLYFAHVIEDSEEKFTTTTPKRLAYVATIAKEVETSSETHFYDNKGMIVIAAKGAETFTLTVAPPALGILAEITGQAFDVTRGMLIEGAVTPRQFAIGYKAKGTDGFWRFVWKYKGMFSIPSEEVNTESDSIDTTNTELTFTAVNTIHKFAYRDDVEAATSGSGTTYNQSVSGIIVDERYERAGNLDEWFTKVMTPEDVVVKTA
nr:MAG TPA: tail tube protein [Caudoviricetes sp.]